MKSAIFLLKSNFSTELYIFEDGLLKGLYFFSNEELKESKFASKMRGVERVFVLLDDSNNYYLNLLKLPYLRSHDLKKTITYELISVFGEKARFAFETVAIREDEAGISSLVSVNGIKESYFNELLEYLKDYRDLIELIISYPISYHNFDSGKGALVLELYEDKTKMTVLMGGTVILYRTIPVGSQRLNPEDLIVRLREEIERITYYVRQNYDRSFELRKVHYFTEDSKVVNFVDKIGIISEKIEVPMYRGGDIAPYILNQKNPKEFILNILPPIVSYREVSHYIYAILSITFLIYSSLFGYSYARLLKYEKTLTKTLENLKAGVYQNLSYIRANRMLLLTSGLSQADVPLEELLKAVSASLEKGMRVTYLKAERQVSDLSFSLVFDFENIPDFKKVDLLESFMKRLNTYGSFRNLRYQIQTQGDKKEYIVSGTMVKRGI